ncbi:Fur-regulated basic protein FbpA [Halobacillus kuroshimensis]|uniref:Fur-regulated basic protein FbpA n=1 Tax=Halobacillus kuroshimensis TaxID=302481 RepID=A0ABS3DWY5_9BACI|nr:MULTISPECIES: Fur-regulated basic protein FbpA [Halobacillus]MBN8235880.1 Fur-regulated basic protein FbpA [Halobacillus kuroshimensis]
MSHHLRAAVDQMKEYYIQKLIEAGIYQAADEILYTLTLTELETLVERLNRP